MLKVTINPQLAEMRAVMSRIERQQLPYATAVALTKTAKFVQADIQREMARVFDRPKKYTLNSLYVRPATKREQWAEVKVKDEAVKSLPPIRWLAPQLYGGGRAQKGFERALERVGLMPAGWRAVPTKAAPIDQYGNVTGGMIVKILSALKAMGEQGYLANRTARSSKRARRRDEYFVALPGREQTRHLRPGIYRRRGAGGVDITPIFLYVNHPPRYRKRLRFFEIAEQVGRMRFPLEFSKAMRAAVSTARA